MKHVVQDLAPCRGSVNDHLFHPSSLSLPCQDVSPLWARFSGWLVLVANLATSGWERRLPLCTLWAAPGRDLGDRQCRQVFPVQPEKICVEVGMGMGEEIRGAGWVPWEEGGESCSPLGAPAPRLRFQP